MRVAVIGAGGLLGGAVAAELHRAGHEVVGLGRALDRSAGTPVPTAAAVAIDVDADPAELRRTLAATDPDVLVDAVGGPRHALAEAAVDLGVPLVDLTADPHVVRERIDHLDDLARQAGVTIVVGAGIVGTPGDLLAAAATSAVTRPREVHVAHVLPDGHLRRAATVGLRRTVTEVVARPALAVQDAQLVEEPIAEARRLAWFPRPVGPHHAVAVPGLDPLFSPRHVPGVRVVRTYLAVRAARAELVQAVANLARWAPARPRVRRWVTGRRPADPSPDLRAATRWACVVETRGDEGVARAWMNGRDPYAAAALFATVLVERVRAGRAAAGVVPPALVDVPGELLDEVADRSRLRWSVIRPDS
ncbi:NAD-dependent epimerase/dehydratase family protein [Nitriliruptoraceae bacterium ZYF776]|nr:NAD-dependent epimerase/dehydratase family protein [Profundirhabdus halotolerans]